MVKNYEDEIYKLRECLRDKDKRIKEIETRWDTIRCIVLWFWYGFLVLGSYTLVFQSWSFIATDGKYGFLDSLNYLLCWPEKLLFSNPFVLSNSINNLLAIFMVIILTLLSLGWTFWFIIRSGAKEE